jgi:pimeloyl-ACP methyl ester carboxylesterase
MPKSWNGNLIVFAHGGPSLDPPTASSNLNSLTRYAAHIRNGYAFAASTYRREGYGVQMAAADTDDARKFFIDRVAKPKRTILQGTSYGGLVGAKLLETYAKGPDGAANYDGALFISGAVGGWRANYEFRADLRAVYQHYCKNLPRPEEPQYPVWMGLSAQSKLTQNELAARIDQCTGLSKPAGERDERQRQNLASILGVIPVPESMLLIHVRYATFMFRDLVQVTTHGRNPFSNMAVRYRGSPDDTALNSQVERFNADPEAVAVMDRDGQPAGALPVPTLSIHSFNDPQVAVEMQHEYRTRVLAAGNGERLVQAYTDETAHAAQSDPEIAAALDRLVNWIEKGEKPTPQSIADSCEKLRAGLGGPCRYHAGYEPKPYSARFPRGSAQ